MNRDRMLLGTGIAALMATTASAENLYSAETVLTGLDRPWAMEFLPGSDQMLLTFRGGSLGLWDGESDEVTVLDGAPDVVARGQGGLLDVAASPEFDGSGWVYMTWVAEVDGGTTTHLGRARLDPGAAELTDLETLHIVQPGIESDAHFGSRIVFQDDHVFVGFGDRNSKAFGPDHIAQDLSSENGSVIRLTLDGDIPDDNPFVDEEDAAAAIWSYGHRNIQAMTVHPETNEIWLAEHGEAGGDEVNIVQRGENFGWPLASFGVTYSGGERFAEPHQEGDGFVAPIHHWPAGRDNHFPPSGMAFYTGDAFADWQGHLMIGNLFHQYIGLFEQEDGGLTEVARLLDGEGHRIRDIAVGPENGAIYVLTDGENARVIRLSPAG